MHGIAHYVKQIDLAFMREIRSPIGQLLCTKLSHLFHEAKEKGWEHVEIEYQWLAERMGVTVYAKLFRARAQLKQAIAELIDSCYVKDATWDGWKIRFTPEVRFLCGEEAPRDQRKLRATQEKRKPSPIAGKSSDKPNDLLLPVCEVYAKNGWQMVEAVARRHNLTEQDVREHTLKRGIQFTFSTL